ncbi:MAG TPA: hypothetical protein VEA81_14435 [Burkholderiaceae bacterium]|nr:hypothetical protein [Burkholderiaceae bacterium]
MSEHTQPSRRALIVGAALVALSGLRDTIAVECRLRGETDYAMNREHAAVGRAMERLRTGGPVDTRDPRVRDLLAFVRQQLRVDADEWTECIHFMETAEA